MVPRSYSRFSQELGIPPHSLQRRDRPWDCLPGLSSPTHLSPSLSLTPLFSCARQAEGYDDASDCGSSASSCGAAAGGSYGSGGGQYLMTITPDVPLRMRTLTARGTFAEGHIYLGALSADAVAYFRDCCETGIEMLNTHNTTHAPAPRGRGAHGSGSGISGNGATVTLARTHQDWVLDVVNALEDVAIVQLGTVGVVKACPRRGW